MTFKQNFIHCLKILLFVLLGSNLMAQNTVSGTITDAETGETLIGVNILIKGTIKGTITDLDGAYSLEVNEELPYTLIVSMVGFETKVIEVTEANATIDISLGTQGIIGDEVVVSASRVEEKVLESPVTIEKLDLLDIKQSTAVDFYDEITRLKGVTNSQASLTFNTINTRGFATGGNTRFVQLQDGMDNAAPLLNFPTGNVVGISELDIKNMELVPGAASALYGPNAFNGILLMESKDPFRYQGLSAQIKTGVVDGRDVSDPIYGFSVRYAKAFNDKFAFKLNVSTLLGKDWEANDYVTDRVLLERAISDSSVDPLSNVGGADFDGLNLYGDETFIPVGNGLKRTGWREEDLLESRDAKSLKYDAAVHYRINDNLETNISYKFGSGSTVYQGSERYALRDFTQQYLKYELNAADWNIRAYGSFTDDGDSYNLTALGAFTNEGIWRSLYTDELGISGGWAVAANLAYNGAFATFGFPGGDDLVAKQFADGGGTNLIPAELKPLIVPGLAAALGLPESVTSILYDNAGGMARPDADSDTFRAIVNSVREGLFQRGGAGFIDDSALYHVEGNYNLSSALNDVVGLQIGANFRRYDLFSDGTVFNEDPDGDGINERIKIDEYGTYLQVSKTLLPEDRLKLTASIRYDKNQNFDGNVTPRVSAVYSAGEDRNHNFRASYQTGFRNPTTQGQYIYFPTTTILLGSTQENAEVFGIHNGGAWTRTSYNNYLGALQAGQSPDAAQALLRVIEFDYIQPEKLQSIDIGYKGLIGKKLFLDINAYFNTYDDFIDQTEVVNINETTARAQALGSPDPVDGTVRVVFNPYINVPVQITSQGYAFAFDYVMGKKWKLSGNYTYSDHDFDREAAVAFGFETYDPGFNTPTHKFNIGLGNREVVKNLGFGITYKWQDEFVYKNTFGSGLIPSYGTLDAQISYKLSSAKSVIKLGVSNLTKNVYRTNVGNPYIGRLVHLTITYDQFAN